MFWSSHDDDERDEAREQEHEQLVAAIDNMSESMKSLQATVSGMRDSFNELRERLDQVDHREEYDVGRISDRLDNHTGEMVDRLKEVQSAITSLHERQRAVETKIDEDYRPELQKEQDLIDTVLDVMRDIQDRLGAYGKLQQNVREMEDSLEGMEETLAGKVGRSEFEELSNRTREDIKHLKARLDMLD